MATGEFRTHTRREAGSKRRPLVDLTDYWRAIRPVVSCLTFTQRSLKLGFGHAPKPGIGYG
jgi:hypothetical protein